MPARPVARVPPWLRIGLPLGLFVASLLVFSPALPGEFLDWDDYVNFVDNPAYRGLGAAQIRWIATTTLMGHYIPLTWLTFALNYVVGGMDPWGYHAVNIALHAGNAVLFYLIARRLLAAAAGVTGEPTPACAWGAAAGAALFALHPLRAESVGWITERRDVLSGCFFLLAVLAYLRATETPVPEGRWRGLSLLAFAAGLLSKASVMTLPVALLILDWYPLRRGAHGWRPLLREKVPYLALAVGGAVVAIAAIRHSVQVTSYSTYGLEARIAMTAYSLFFYPARLLWPVGLSPLYEAPAAIHLWQPRFLVPAIVVVVTTGALAALRRRWPGALAAWVYSGVMVAPTSGIVHAGFQLAHDRYSYLSGLGFAVLAGGGLAAVIRMRERGRVSTAVTAAVAGVAALALVALAANTVGQTRIWRDSESLWRAAVDVDPRCSVCAENLGAVLARAGRYDEAFPLLRFAYAASPDRARHSLAYALRNLGEDLARQGRRAEATEALRQAVALTPEDGEARQLLERVTGDPPGRPVVRDGRETAARPRLERRGDLR